MDYTTLTPGTPYLHYEVEACPVCGRPGISEWFSAGRRIFHRAPGPGWQQEKDTCWIPNPGSRDFGLGRVTR